MEEEPRFVVWLPTMHRLAASETGKQVLHTLLYWIYFSTQPLYGVCVLVPN